MVLNLILAQSIESCNPIKMLTQCRIVTFNEFNSFRCLEVVRKGHDLTFSYHLHSEGEGLNREEGWGG